MVEIAFPTQKFGFAASAGQNEPPLVITKTGKRSFAWGVWDEFLKKQRTRGKPIPGENLRRWRNSKIVGDDFRLAKTVGVDHFRISVNPTRVLDPRGTVKKEGLDFYSEIFDAAKESNLKLILAFHHLQRPLGIDWSEAKSVDYWSALCETIIRHFGNREELIGLMPHGEPLGAPLSTAYLKGGLFPYIHSFKFRKLVVENMVRFQERTVSLVEKYWQRDKKNKPMIIFAHAWIPAHPKHLPLIENSLVSLWQENWNINAIRKFVSPEIVLGLDVYAYLPLGLSTLFTPRGWPVLYRPYRDPKPEATRIAVEQAKMAFPGVKLAVTEMGLGEPENLDDQKRPEYLRQSLEELLRLTGKIKLEFIDFWTLVDNMEWVDGDKIRFGVARDIGEGPELKKSGEVLKKILQVTERDRLLRNE